MSTANERKQLEEQIIHLMLSHHDLVGEFNNSQNRTHHFLKEHQVVLDAMFEASAASAALTRFTLREFLSQRNLLKQEIIAYESLYHNIRLLTGVKRDDFHALLKKKRAMWVDDQTIAQIDRFTKNHKDDPIYAAKELAEKVSATLDEVDKPSYVTFDTLDNEQFIKGYLDDQELRRQHDEPNLTCGISEIDSVMGTGFSPETLTVIAADVGSYKSTLMLNIALGVWEKHGADVLFVPLEMPKYRIVDKIVSRELGIDGNTLAKPKFLKPVELEKVRGIRERFATRGGQFAILEIGERTTVNAIRRQIEKHLSHHQPKLVVIDYIANLLPDRPNPKRNDLEIGDMLKDLLKMGKPGVVTPAGFAVVTGAQLSREALKKIRAARDLTSISLGSEDIQGSHQYSADASSIFALYKKSPADGLHLPAEEPVRDHLSTRPVSRRQPPAATSS
jgi:replicative DNA helicase